MKRVHLRDNVVMLLAAAFVGVCVVVIVATISHLQQQADERTAFLESHPKGSILSLDSRANLDVFFRIESADGNQLYGELLLRPREEFRIDRIDTHPDLSGRVCRFSVSLKGSVDQFELEQFDRCFELHAFHLVTQGIHSYQSES